MLSVFVQLAVLLSFRIDDCKLFSFTLYLWRSVVLARKVIMMSWCILVVSIEVSQSFLRNIKVTFGISWFSFSGGSTSTLTHLLPRLATLLETCLM